MIRFFTRIRRIWRELLCGHIFQPDGYQPGTQGMLVRRRCIRCSKREYSHQVVRRRLG